MHAGLNLDKPVDYINTHGTSTPVGDTSELAAISSTEAKYRLYPPQIFDRSHPWSCWSA